MYMARVTSLVADLREYAALLRIAEYAASDRNHKSIAYERAANSIESQYSHGVITGQLRERLLALQKTEHVGEATMKLVKQWLERGKIAELEKLRKSKVGRAYRELAPLLGVGPATIAKWMMKGVTTREELKSAVKRGRVELTNAQRLGLKYFKDLHTRIPRAETRKIALVVGKRVLSPSQSCKDTVQSCKDTVRLFIAGSYRRGAETSGDIDLLLMCNEELAIESMRAVESIEKDKRFMGWILRGASRLSFLYKCAAVRQVDVLHVLPANLGASLLYFTGSGAFNVAMRSYARSKGLLLNQHGLFENTTPPKRLAASSERELFALVGIKYREPAQRNGPADVVPI
jgi:DNA polymerase/3'-5' exonuclease PolX